MSLSKKTFLYSIVLAVIMAAFITGYFTLMLPSLYVDYVKRSDLDSAVELQKGYMENGSYDGLTVKNPSAALSIEIPWEKDVVYATGKFFSLTVEVQDEELRELLAQLRDMARRLEGAQGYGLRESLPEDEEPSWEEVSALWAGWGEKLRDKFAFREESAGQYPVRVQARARQEQGVYREEYTKLHTTASGILVCEMGVSDGDYGYTTYLAVSQTDRAFILTILPTMTPGMGEITPVVLESLPMIAAVVFLVTLVLARFFSARIVNPVIRLADYAESARLSDRFEEEVFGAGGEAAESGDEIAALGRALQELYDRLRKSCLELEEKNRFLEEENIRKEVFLRSSSHQLKTPVAAALLLVEGMMDGVGKYKNTGKYLPEVKSRLLAMKKIIDDTLHTLYLGGHGEGRRKEVVPVEELVRELTKAYAVWAGVKNLDIVVEGRGEVLTDVELLKKILDNLLSNAVQYTALGGRIEIRADENKICIRNCAAHIEENILPNIFEPFVSSDAEGKGRGLGLYVAAYYSRLLGYELTVVNGENCVQARLLLSPAQERCEAADECLERKRRG